MTANEQKLEINNAQIWATPEPLRVLHNLKTGVDALREKLAADVVASAGYSMASTPSIANQNVASVGIAADCAHQILQMWKMGACGQAELNALARLDSLKTVLASHPQMPEAQTQLDPLMAERERLTAAIAAEAQAHAEAHARADHAHRAAVEAATAAAENHPDVIAARKALAAFDPTPEPEPAKPFRGKVPIGKPPADLNILPMLADD